MYDWSQSERRELPSLTRWSLIKASTAEKGSGSTSDAAWKNSKQSYSLISGHFELTALPLLPALPLMHQVPNIVQEQSYFRKCAVVSE